MKCAVVLSVVASETMRDDSVSPLDQQAGEGGAIAPPVVIANAVCDALKPFAAEINATPVRWEQVAAILGHDLDENRS
jgi:hypothetical protein